jgi:hypothetical protein
VNKEVRIMENEYTHENGMRKIIPFSAKKPVIQTGFRYK